MLNSIVSQVIAGIIVAAVIALIQYLFRKYRRLNHWDKVAILQIVNLVWTTLIVFLGFFSITNLSAKIILFIASFISFVSSLIMFVTVIRVIKSLHSLIDKISCKNSDNSNHQLED